MSLPTTPRAYDDCYDLWEKALNDAKGIRVAMRDIDSATYFRMRMHQARKLMRQGNTMLYAEDHPLYNGTVYDCLAIRDPRVIDGKVWLYIEKYLAITDERIESLVGIEDHYVDYEVIEPPKAISAPEPRQLTFRRV